MRRLALWAIVLALGCGARPATTTTATTIATEAPPEPIVISIVGTNDLHGHIRALPLLGGYLRNLRQIRARDGAVVLLDGGDLFQGTLESNLGEGDAVVRAYAALGYDAVAIGNHEFDFGPVGARSTSHDLTDDPRGALRARMAEAPFPFLNANVVSAEASGEHAGIGQTSTTIERAGVKIAIIGVTTESTPASTVAANFIGLAISPLAATIEQQAQLARSAGAELVVVVAHAGGDCSSFENPDDLSSCDDDEEIMNVARALPAGAIDAIIAGHTHQAVAHRVNGIAIIESFALGAAFGRIDFVIDPTNHHVLDARIHPPQRLCTAEGASPEGPIETCMPGSYEGAAIELDVSVAQAIAPAIESAEDLRNRPIGVSLAAPFTHQRGSESALANLFGAMMLAAHHADAAILNGGGVRADLPAGELRYGSLYEAFPFDNRFAIVRMQAHELAQMIADNLTREGSFFTLAGLRAEARCNRGALRVILRRENGTAVPDRASLSVITSDFLATGGDGAFAQMHDRTAIDVEAPLIREAISSQLEALHGARLDPTAYFDPSRPRVRFLGARPVQCAN